MTERRNGYEDLRIALVRHDERTKATAKVVDEIKNGQQQIIHDMKAIHETAVETRVLAKGTEESLKSARSHLQGLSEDHAATRAMVEADQKKKPVRSVIVGFVAILLLFSMYHINPEAAEQTIVSIKSLVVP